MTIDIAGLLVILADYANESGGGRVEEVLLVARDALTTLSAKNAELDSFYLASIQLLNNQIAALEAKNAELERIALHNQKKYERERDLYDALQAKLAAAEARGKRMEEALNAEPVMWRDPDKDDYCLVQKVGWLPLILKPLPEAAGREGAKS